MENLAKWMGYVKAVNHTKKMAYFKTVKGDSLELIAHVKDYDPRTHPEQFVALFDIAIQRGAEITVNKKKQRTSSTINVEAVVLINNQIHQGKGIDPVRAIVHALRRYTDKLFYN